MVRGLLAAALLGLSASGTGQQTGERSPAAIAFERATRIATEVTPLDPATLGFRPDRVAFLGYTEQGGVRTISWVRTYLNQSRR